MDSLFLLVESIESATYASLYLMYLTGIAVNIGFTLSKAESPFIVDDANFWAVEMIGSLLSWLLVAIRVGYRLGSGK